ncbi:MAG TPA: HAMP domain-containing histidine kinase [Desulfobacterales bacterium]|nr:HAMP domain-containing histidine kinase [Desulfobacterales bacterium]
MKLSQKDQRLLSTERLKATSRMASEMAHELNTPLGGILMYSHLLLEDMPENDPNRKKVLKINELAHRCKIIGQGLCDFSYQEGPHPKPVQINRILYNVIGFLEEHLLLRDISIQTCFNSDLPMVTGDENRLEQAFINVMINAAQSMDGTGTLTLRTEFAPATNTVRIECFDTGLGIEDRNLGRAFEPFHATNKKGTGTGMSLSICHAIVEQHGGTITIESSKRHGSTFTIFLPVADIDAAPPVDQVVTL